MWNLFPDYVCWFSMTEHLLMQWKTAQHGSLCKWKKISFIPPSTLCLHFVSIFMPAIFFWWMRTDLLSQYMFIVFQKLSVHIKLKFKQMKGKVIWPSFCFDLQDSLALQPLFSNRKSSLFGYECHSYSNDNLEILIFKSRLKKITRWEII